MFSWCYALQNHVRPQRQAETYSTIFIHKQQEGYRVNILKANFFKAVLLLLKMIQTSGAQIQSKLYLIHFKNTFPTLYHLANWAQLFKAR